VTGYVVRRALYLATSLLGIALLAFVMLRVAGGDPAVLLAGENPDPAVVETIRHELGLDQPAPIQFARFIAAAVHGDFGKSYITRRAVSDEILRRLPNTLTLASGAILFATLGGLALGIIAALRTGSSTDHAMMLIAVVGLSVPSFWLALILIYVFSLQLHLLPTVGLQGPQYFLMPGLVMSTYSLAQTARLTRSGMLEVLHNDYIRTARATGLAESTVLLRHALRNMILPVITLAGVSFGYMLGTSVVVEVVFSIDGIGQMIVSGVLSRDTPIVVGGLMVLAGIFATILALMDVLQATVDPRIRT
jgi:peptide/nickel transport system permease protein